jgi:hypothetical protein
MARNMLRAITMPREYGGMIEFVYGIVQGVMGQAQSSAPEANRPLQRFTDKWNAGRVRSSKR